MLIDLLWKMGLFSFSLSFVCRNEKLMGPLLCWWQVENEYGPMEYELGAPGRAYATWAAKMAVSLKTGVPWVMCKQDDAPDPVVSISVLAPLFSYCLFDAPTALKISVDWTKPQVSSYI